MRLLALAARVCRAFEQYTSDQTRMVQKVKGGQVRDVVTDLDLKLHSLSQDFVRECLEGARLLSEEGGLAGISAGDLLVGDWLVVDPLDGSNNYATGLPNYGYMAAHLRSGKVAGTVIVLPEQDQYIVTEDGRTLFAQPLSQGRGRESRTVYYAYPPMQDAQARRARNALSEVIDTRAAGMYRHGSACVGLYQLLSGRHLAFVGHGIRVWDAIAFLPALAAQGLSVHYRLEGLTITLVAGSDPVFTDVLASVLDSEQGLQLQRYDKSGTLMEFAH